MLAADERTRHRRITQDPSVRSQQRINDSSMRDWFVEHGQGSGKQRHRALGEPPSGAHGTANGPREPSKALEAIILVRDRFHCRYCGIPVITRKLLDAFGACVGSVALPLGRRNSEKHGAALVSQSVIDHVLPYQGGGETSLENLVTACWTCSFGKDRFTVSQLGLDDPRQRAPIETSWDGLTSHLPNLVAVARRTIADRAPLDA